jgi:hypothetical protein
MKLEDINQKLTERPGGFGGIVKAKAKKQLSPFMKGRQQSADDEVRLIKVARDIKKDLKAWMQKAFRSSGGAKAPLTMNQFLGWVQKTQPKYAKGIETFARGDEAYSQHFNKKIDSKGKVSNTASDDKVKRRGVEGEKAEVVDQSQDQEDMISPEEMTGGKKKRELSPEEQAGFDKINKAAEEEAAEFEKEDLKASKGEDEEPKVDTSASIYEARLRAILEADEEGVDTDVDVGVNAATVLKDNEIDTLITMGIEKQIELDGGESIIDDPTELASQGVATAAAGKRQSGDAADVDKDEIVARWGDKVKGFNKEVAALLKSDKNLYKKFQKIQKQYWDSSLHG